MFKKLFGIGKKKDEANNEEKDLNQEAVAVEDTEATEVPTETPEIPSPLIEEPEIKDPIIEEPEIPTPSTEEPEIETPKIDQPEIEVPTIEEPEIPDPKPDELIKEEVFVAASEDTKLEEEPKKKLGFLERLKNGLTKTRDAVSSSIDNLLNGKADIDDDLYDELEEIMISADIGVETTMKIIDQLRDHIAINHIRNPKDIKSHLIKIMKDELQLKNSNNDLNFVDDKPLVVLVIGVNGVGKTTTIGKLANNIKKEGKTVTLAAADTFRAAAIQQLQEWANRAGVELISHSEGADPASVVFDAISSHKSKSKDCLIIDTAGRLHNKKNLMNELEKINRIIEKQYPEASRETLLVLDATTGQNAIYQAKEFNKVADISGIVLTKLDGTAKGGVVFPLQVEHNIPVKYIGIGEGLENLEKFDSDKFVDAMFA